MIYFIQAGQNGPIKIGKSDDPERRLGQLQTGHYEKLRLLWVSFAPDSDEEKLHDLFKDVHIRGEWFEPEDVILKLMDYTNSCFVTVWSEGKKRNIKVNYNFGLYELSVELDDEDSGND